MLRVCCRRLFTPARVTDEHLATFFRDGIACVPGVVSPEDCDTLRAEATRLTELEARRRATEKDTNTAVFSTITKEHSDNAYFMTSGDKIRFFLEKGCTEVSINTVNKIGHALHTDGGVFQRFCARQDFKGLLRRLGHRQPSAIQSMYIVKPPFVGGEVVPHQDSTWLLTTPTTVVGIWFALEDCTVNNACLTAVKGSHFTHSLSAHAYLDEGSTLSQTLYGDLPKVEPHQLEPIECAKGSLVFFNGQCVHGSAPNNSPNSRHAFVFHAVDDNAVWCERNWIAPTVSRLAL
jgi:phytanoyl-CoA hydroxylase